MNTDEKAMEKFRDGMSKIPGDYPVLMMHFFDFWKRHNPAASDAEHTAVFAGFCNGAQSAFILARKLEEKELELVIKALAAFMAELFEFPAGEGLH